MEPKPLPVIYQIRRQIAWWKLYLYDRLVMTSWGPEEGHQERNKSRFGWIEKSAIKTLNSLPGSEVI